MEEEERAMRRRAHSFSSGVRNLAKAAQCGRRKLDGVNQSEWRESCRRRTANIQSKDGRGDGDRAFDQEEVLPAVKSTFDLKALAYAVVSMIDVQIVQGFREDLRHTQ